MKCIDVKMTELGVYKNPNFTSTHQHAERYGLNWDSQPLTDLFIVALLVLSLLSLGRKRLSIPVSLMFFFSFLVFGKPGHNNQNQCLNFPYMFLFGDELTDQGRTFALSNGQSLSCFWNMWMEDSVMDPTLVIVLHNPFARVKVKKKKKKRKEVLVKPYLNI